MRLVLAAAPASAAVATPHLHLPRSSSVEFLALKSEQVAQHSIVSSTKWDVSTLDPKEDICGVIHISRCYKPKPLRKIVCAAVGSGNRLSNDSAESFDLPPPGCTRVKVELNRPLGIVLEEDKAGNIFVAEVAADGNADKSGLIDVGDQLIATSAIVYGSEDYYQGVRVRKGMQVVRLSVYGEKFETVMAAIGTHPAHVKVALEIQKCQRPTIKTDSNGATN